MCKKTFWWRVHAKQYGVGGFVCMGADSMCPHNDPRYYLYTYMYDIPSYIYLLLFCLYLKRTFMLHVLWIGCFSSVWWNISLLLLGNIQIQWEKNNVPWSEPPLYHLTLCISHLRLHWVKLIKLFRCITVCHLFLCYTKWWFDAADRTTFSCFLIKFIVFNGY